MDRKELLKHLTSIILDMKKDRPLLLGIDGVDVSGKTTLAKELANELKESGRLLIQASIDGFHNPKSVRYKEGNSSHKGYYLYSFDHESVIDELLKPLSIGDLQYRTAVFDHFTDSKVVHPVQTATNDSILIMEGIFLFRPELVDFWDIKIFLDVDFETILERAVKRETERECIGTEQEIRKRYEDRYIPGQKFYFQIAEPIEKADIVIDNSDFKNPMITKGK